MYHFKTNYQSQEKKKKNGRDWFCKQNCDYIVISGRLSFDICNNAHKPDYIRF